MQVSFDLPDVNETGVVHYVSELVKGSSLFALLRRGAESDD